ncbi:cAMP phosphodiesterase [Synechococcus sp. CCY 9618]|uniref:cAMP phosphodiesterase n=1 Tax=Synechococcus sp. CCY 9618 TaxID=2815602 RepID=UPI0020B3C0D4|nr:cAMP phosphodiesterase [Synechococcus sp. CCY 9618]
MSLLLRRTRPLLVASLVVMPLLLSPTAVHAAPATPAEMGLYTRIAAVNVCISRSAGIDFDKSVGIAGETIAQLILGQHKGEIQQVGTKALTLEELRRGSVNSAVLGSAEICPKEVPADVMKKVQDAIKQQGTNKPAP